MEGVVKELAENNLFLERWFYFSCSFGKRTKTTAVLLNYMIIHEDIHGKMNIVHVRCYWVILVCVIVCFRFGTLTVDGGIRNVDRMWPLSSDCSFFITSVSSLYIWIECKYTRETPFLYYIMNIFQSLAFIFIYVTLYNFIRMIIREFLLCSWSLGEWWLHVLNTSAVIPSMAWIMNRC